MNISLVNNYCKFSFKAQNHTGGRKPIEVYAISPDGSCKKYNSLSEMAAEYGVVKQAIASSYREGYKYHGMLIKKTSDVEDESGKIDENKIKKLLQKRPKWAIKMIPVYAISRDGEYVKYESLKDMARTVNRPDSNINAALRLGYRVNGFIVKLANEIEDKQGKVDPLKIQDALKEYKKKDEIVQAKRLLPRKRKSKLIGEIKIKQKKENENIKENKPIYAINIKNGRYIKFPSIEKVSETFGLHPNSIKQFMKNVKLAVGNFRLVSASNLENQDGRVDKNKVKQFVKLA